MLPALIPFALVLTTACQEAEYKKLNEQAMSLYRQGKYEEGITIAARALESAEKSLGKDHPDVATSLNNLAALVQISGTILGSGASVQAVFGDLRTEARQGQSPGS